MANNIFFIINMLYDEGYHNLWSLDKDKLSLVNEKTRDMVFIKNTINLEIGYYSIEIEGDLNFSAQSKWNNYSLLDNYTLSNDKKGKQLKEKKFSFVKLKDTKELNLHSLTLSENKGEKLLDNKFIISNNLIKPLELNSSKEEFNSNTYNEETIKSLKDMHKKKISFRDINGDIVKTGSEYIYLNNSFYKYYSYE